MRRAPALPFEAYKFTGTKRPRSCEADTSIPTASLQILQVASPAPPSPDSTTPAPPSTSNNNPSSLLKSTPPTYKHAPSTVDPYTVPTGGLPAELLGNSPLRLIIIGHNPSDIAWKRGHYYANPSNWMWRILQNTNLAPVDVISGCNDDFKLPGSMGIGFTDVGSGTPGTDSNQFKTTHFDEWRQPFYDRLRAHVNRASENVEKCRCGRCGAPVAVVFSGKKQFSELFEKPVGKGRKKDTTFFNHTGINNQKIGTNYTLGGDDSKIKPTTQLFKPAQIPFGRQSILPAGWPLPLDKTEVWVMTSTSGAAAMTKEARYAPWKALAEWLESVPWPLNRQARCSRDIDMNT